MTNSMVEFLFSELYNRSSWVSLDTAEKQAHKADATICGCSTVINPACRSGFISVLSAQDNLEFVRAESGGWSSIRTN